MRRKIACIIFNVITVLFLTACHAKEPANQLRVGTISGPETKLMEVAKNVAQETYGLHLKIISFTDYGLPNESLADGSIDANMFQHMPYFLAWKDVHHASLTAIAKTFIYPMGIYSYKINRVSEITYNNIIAIPNDPTNEARALLLLQKAGLITLKSGTTIMATTHDIQSNPLNLVIKTLDAAQLSRVLEDVTAAVINTNYAILAGLQPTVSGRNGKKYRHAIYLEGKDSLYANLFVVRTRDVNNPKIKEMVKSFQSPQVLAAAQSIFGGTAIKAW